MVDIMSKEARSDRMSRIRSKDTKPELLVRQALWREGFRYRLHSDKLPGKPDVVLPGMKTVVLVHGCYWHGHSCQKGRIPGTNSPFWAAKFTANKARDRRNKARLKALGWKVVTVWECSLATEAKRKRMLSKLTATLRRMREEQKLLDSPDSP